MASNPEMIIADVITADAITADAITATAVTADAVTEAYTCLWKVAALLLVVNHVKNF